MRILSLAGLAFLAACSGDSVGIDSDSAVEADADTDTDTDTDTDADTDSDTDADVETELTYVIDGAFDGTAVSLHAFSTGTGELGSMLTSAAVNSDGPSLFVTEPPEADREDFDEDTEIVLYVTGLSEDDDGDGGPDVGEVYTGVSTAYVIWIGAESLPQELAFLGLKLGWNAAYIGEEEIEVYPIDAIPLPVLETNLKLSLSGTYTEEAEPQAKESVRLMLAPYALLSGGEVKDYLYDEPLGSTFEIALSGAPGESHLVRDNPELPEGSAVESPVAYLDQDFSEGYSEGDAPIGNTCKDGRPVAGFWIPRTDDLATTVFLGGFSGWTAVFLDDNFEILGNNVEGLTVEACADDGGGDGDPGPN